MKIIYNSKVIPFPGYRAINLFGVMFVRGNRPLDEVTINHENIHSKQIIDVLLLTLIPFAFLFFLVGKLWLILLLWITSYYGFYVTEWIVRLISYKFNTRDAYRNISFEREAFANEKNLDYLKNRERFSFIRYFKKVE